MPGTMNGKVALVAGGSSGFGRASAILFARKGARVVVAADKNIEGGKETARMIQEVGGEAIFLKADVSRAVEVENLVKQTVQTYGSLDYAHNSAGIIGSGKAGFGDQAGTLSCSEETWDRVIDVNLKGTWLLMKYEIPEMLKKGKGAIVNTSSVAGLVASSLGLVAYTGSKHGVIGLTKAAALEFATRGIRVNAVCPGTIRTAMNENYFLADPQLESRLALLNPMNRLGTVTEVAEVVVWLCSEAASFITGHAVPVDGGAVAR
jgi:NAD(P)-dependent dehydrogenase (short-subunit alcohol dehydrogenase family)